MSENLLIGIIGAALTIINGLSFFILVGIKSDTADLWKRLYNHYHEIECENKACAKVKTGNVVVPHEGA
jgi:hypothetical protein